MTLHEDRFRSNLQLKKQVVHVTYNILCLLINLGY